MESFHARTRAVDVEDLQIESVTSYTSTITGKSNTSSIAAATGLSLAAIGGHVGIKSFHGQETISVQNAKHSTSLPVRSKKVSFTMPDPVPIKRQMPDGLPHSDEESTPESEIIGELCQAMLVSREASYLGILVDEEGRRHRVSMLKTPLRNHAIQTVSLQALLEETPVKKLDRLILGVKLASTLLQLYSTPWLEEKLGKRDIFFKRQGQGIETALLDRPLLSKDFGSSNCRTSPSEPDNAVLPSQAVHSRNPSIFALGVLLIELWFGKPLDQLRHPEDLGPQNQVNDITDFATTSRLVDTVYEEAGATYGEAVWRCVRCEFEQRSSSLDTEALKQAVHNGVVSQLEKNLEFFCGGNFREVMASKNDSDIQDRYH